MSFTPSKPVKVTVEFEDSNGRPVTRKFLLCDVDYSESRDQLPVIDEQGVTHYVFGKEHTMSVSGRVLREIPVAHHAEGVK